MTDKELKDLKDNLWHSADILRQGARLAANKYGQPILGLIFLRYADILFKQRKNEIEQEYDAEKLKSKMIEIKKCMTLEKDKAMMKLKLIEEKINMCINER